jgi:hypothetical protein
MASRYVGGAAAYVNDIKLSFHRVIWLEYPHAFNERSVSWRYDNISNAQSRAIVGNLFRAREIDDLFGEASLLGGSNPQSDSESGHDQRRECREKSVVSINETQRANRLEFDDDGDDEAIVLGSLAALLTGILTYAGLKRRGDLIFGPNKNG